MHGFRIEDVEVVVPRVLVIFPDRKSLLRRAPRRRDLWRAPYGVDPDNDHARLRRVARKELYRLSLLPCAAIWDAQIGEATADLPVQQFGIEQHHRGRSKDGAVKTAVPDHAGKFEAWIQHETVMLPSRRESEIVVGIDDHHEEASRDKGGDQRTEERRNEPSPAHGPPGRSAGLVTGRLLVQG